MSAVGVQRQGPSKDEGTDNAGALLAAHVISAMPDRAYRDGDLLRLARRMIAAYVEMPAFEGGAVLLRDDAGRLQLAGSSDHQVTSIEQTQLRARSGPAPEAVAQGAPVSIWLSDNPGRWRMFTAAAREAGYRGVEALPLRVGGRTIGVVDLYLPGPDRLAAPARRVAVSFAQLGATILWQHGLWGKATARIEQLQTALDVRVVLEQAKGMLARHASVDVGTAFEALRSFARQRNLLLDEVAASLVAGSRSLDDVPVGR
ncbi:MAG TPA: GAF and ANTAR domain-containing protein [Nocardioidaceae bacterium]|nr:GAF and ANTAR domain-containing protein [Nocardioidaceae bacterium]